MVKNGSIFLILLITVFYSINCSSTFLRKSNLNNRVLEREQEVIQSNAYEAFCFLNVNSTVYDLNPLNIPTYDYNMTDGKYSMYFNFCKKALTQCDKKNTTALAVMASNADKNICFSLGGSTKTVSKWNFINDTEANVTSLELVLSAGEECKNDPSKKYETIYQVVCDQNATLPRFDPNFRFNSEFCTNRIKVYSQAGCPQLNFYSIFRSVISNKFIFGPVLMGFGIFLCFFGNYFLFILCLLIGVLSVAFLLLFLLFSNMNVVFSTGVFWAIIAVTVILGIAIGFVLSKNEWIVDFVVGGFAGFFLGLFLYNFVFNRINSNPKVVFWFTIVTAIALVILLVFCFKTFVVICGTSFIGAYGIIRGLSLMLGGFPDENQVMDLIANREWAQVKLLLTSSVYMYLCGYLIIFLAGAIIQYKYFNRFAEKKESKDKKDKADLGEHENLLPAKK